MQNTSLDFRALGALAVVLGVLVAASSSAGGCGSNEGGGGGTSSSATTTTTTGSAGAAGGTGGAGGTMTTTTSSTTSTGGASTGGTGGAATGGSGGSGETWPACHACLQTECKKELEDCNAGCAPLGGGGGAGGGGAGGAAPTSKVCCRDLQACIDAVCGTLSLLGAADEWKCQVYCQSRYFSTKQPHISLVDCAQAALSPMACAPPCASAPYDFEQCVNDASAGVCASAIDACDAEPECIAYRTCVMTCTTSDECIACGAPAGSPLPVGQQLWEGYWKCVASQCMTEAWLPQF